MYKIIALKFVAFEYSYLTVLNIFQREEMQTSEPRVTLRYTLNGKCLLYLNFADEDFTKATFNIFQCECITLSFLII